jgi:hypothetical protein
MNLHFQPTQLAYLLSTPSMIREPFRIVIRNLEIFQSAICLYYIITFRFEN